MVLQASSVLPITPGILSWVLSPLGSTSAGKEELEGSAYGWEAQLPRFKS